MPGPGQYSNYQQIARGQQNAAQRAHAQRHFSQYTGDGGESSATQRPTGFLDGLWGALSGFGNMLASSLGFGETEAQKMAKDLEAPPPTEWRNELEGRANALMDARVADVNAQYDAFATDQARAAALADEARGHMDDVRGHFDQTMQTVSNGFDQSMMRINELTAKSNDLWNADFGKEEALADVMRGRSEALQGATQTIQGTVQQTLMQIDADPNLTQAQKAQMKSQARIGGATQMAPAIGKAVEGYNKIEADLHTAFGRMEADSKITAATMWETAANATVMAESARAEAMTTLTAKRAEAEMLGDNLQMALLAEQHTPYKAFSDIFDENYTLYKDILGEEASEAMAWYGMELQRIGLAAGDEQSTFSNLLGLFSIGPFANTLKGVGANIKHWLA